MQIRVKMWGNLRRFAPDGVSETDMQVADDATIADLMATMGAEHEVFAASVNGKVVSLSTPLSPNDRVLLFDHIIGG
jgi:sulfur carrier protein ThiS